MSAFADLLSVDFGRYALVAGLLVAVLGSLVGFFVVLRRMAFVTVGLSHAALGGVALGVLLGHSPVVWAIGFTVVVALGMSALGQSGMSEDTAMGVFFPAAMAFGVVVINLSKAWQRDLFAYLFGSILAVRPADLWLLGGVTLVIAALVTIYFRELLFISFDEESAHAAGIPVAPFRTLLLVLCAVTVVVAIKVVGTVLVSAMLVIPSAAATQVTRRWPAMLLISWLVATSALTGGLLLSFASPANAQIPAGASAVLVAALLFACAAGLGEWLRRRSSANAPPLAPVQLGAIAED